MDLSKISKALGAATGGGATGGVAGIVGVAVGLLPPGSPTWSYVAVILGATSIGAAVPFFTTYFAPANKQA